LFIIADVIAVSVRQFHTTGDRRKWERRETENSGTTVVKLKRRETQNQSLAPA
jgi:hypothetical protein